MLIKYIMKNSQNKIKMHYKNLFFDFVMHFLLKQIGNKEIK